MVEALLGVEELLSLDEFEFDGALLLLEESELPPLATALFESLFDVLVFLVLLDLRLSVT